MPLDANKEAKRRDYTAKLQALFKGVGSSGVSITYDDQFKPVGVNKSPGAYIIDMPYGHTLGRGAFADGIIRLMSSVTSADPDRSYSYAAMKYVTDSRGEHCVFTVNPAMIDKFYDGVDGLIQLRAGHSSATRPAPMAAPVAAKPPAPFLVTQRPNAPVTVAKAHAQWAKPLSSEQQMAMRIAAHREEEAKKKPTNPPGGGGKQIS